MPPVLLLLCSKKHGNVTSLEYDKECCEFLRNVVDMDVVNGSLTELPFANATFNVVCAFDVIEHIDEDQLAMKEINRVLKPNGFVFLTVPAFGFLWSHHDEVNHHFRRYTLQELQRLVEKNGINVTFRSYFNFFLFLPVLALRLLTKAIPKRTSSSSKESTGSDFEYFQSSETLNNILFQIFKCENGFLKRGIRFPAGVSALLIGSKKIDFGKSTVSRIE